MNRNDTEFLAQNIRAQYTEPVATELDALRELDRKVKSPANIFAYIYGSVSALITGAGMSLVMTEIGAALGTLAMPLGIGIGVVGLALCATTYPIYSAILNSRKLKYKDEILRLSGKILGE